MFMISQLIRLDVDNVHNLISSTIANFRNKATFPRRQHARCVRLYGNYDEFCLNGGGGFDQFLKAEVGEKSKSIRQCFTLHTGQKIPAAPPNPSSQANTNGLASMSDRAMAFKLLFNRIPVLFRFFLVGSQQNPSISLLSHPPTSKQIGQLASIGRSGRPCCITQLTGWFGTRMPVWHSCPEPA